MNTYGITGDPSVIWLGLGLLVIGVVATIWMLVTLWKDRHKPKPPPVSERQNPPLPPRGRRPNDGGNHDLRGGGPGAAGE